jgi:hypothetical protein
MFMAETVQQLGYGGASIAKTKWVFVMFAE